ncbi:RsmB/NOP family class I SAM-dependent RNA methyltransferase [Thermogladius sp. 4427co]|uniref:RsmB/NOP family class I SAM-dependent RNA methyltransferase n=1 Tax=Thermogladius sp. 4427co TaxID=3450718 RepID=UPI003F78ED2E
MGKGVTVSDIYREIYIEPGDKAKELAATYGYLPYMVQRYLVMLGLNETIALLEAFEKPVKPVVRTNTVLIDPDKLALRLEQLGFRLEEIKWWKGAFRVVNQPEHPTIGSTHEYLKGLYYVHRDASALIPVILLLHEYRGDVLDACAAPGGKATFAAQIVWGSGRVYANDIYLPRLKALAGHVMRMKLSNITVMWNDARILYKKWSKRYERIILDVPCSSEGTIMNDPSRKTKTKIRDLAILVRREIELLKAGIEMLSKDGVLAYITCSIAPEENEYVVSKILESRSDVDIVEPPLKLFDWSTGLTRFHRLVFDDRVRKCVRIWPHRHSMFGFTFCLLTKNRG